MPGEHEEISPLGDEVQPAPEMPAYWVGPFREGGLIERAGQLSTGVSGILNPRDVAVEQVAESATGTNTGNKWEVVQDKVVATGEVSSKLAEAMIMGLDPEKIVFPVCPDMDVIDSVLGELAYTPLALGHGQLPENVRLAWGKYLNAQGEYVRSINGRPGSLVDVIINMPEWLSYRPDFDILEGALLLDVEISGTVASSVGRGIKYCNVRFLNEVAAPSRVGDEASHSTFIFDNILRATASFRNAKNVSIILVAGTDAETKLGLMESSRVENNTSRTCKVQFKNDTGCTVAGNASAFVVERIT